MLVNVAVQKIQTLANPATAEENIEKHRETYRRTLSGGPLAKRVQLQWEVIPDGRLDGPTIEKARRCMRAMRAHGTISSSPFALEHCSIRHWAAMVTQVRWSTTKNAVRQCGIISSGTQGTKAAHHAIFYPSREIADDSDC